MRTPPRRRSWTSLIASMRSLAGDAWTPAFERAWSDAFEVVASVMLEGAAEAELAAAA